jgi:hypothetical protein
MPPIPPPPSAPVADVPVAPTSAPVAVQPPPPPPPAADPPRTLALENGMERVSDAGLEESLEAWADGKEFKLDHVIKRTGVFLEVAPIIKWEDHKKREKNPADHDRIVRESIEKAKELVAAAKAGKTDDIKPLSDQLLQLCVDCHTTYK